MHAALSGWTDVRREQINSSVSAFGSGSSGKASTLEDCALVGECSCQKESRSEWSSKSLLSVGVQVYCSSARPGGSMIQSTPFALAARFHRDRFVQPARSVTCRCMRMAPAREPSAKSGTFLELQLCLHVPMYLRVCRHGRYCISVHDRFSKVQRSVIEFVGIAELGRVLHGPLGSTLLPLPQFAGRLFTNAPTAPR